MTVKNLSRIDTLSKDPQVMGAVTRLPRSGRDVGMIRSGWLPTFTTFDVGEMLDIGLRPTFIDGAVRPIDHVAQVVKTPGEVDRLVSAFDNHGAVVVEEPAAFPDGVCDDTLPIALHKYMATVQTASGLLVIGAPMSAGDQLSQHLATFGEQVPHHLAVLVTDIEVATNDWKARGWNAGPITDDGSLAQIFLGNPTSGQLVELISRREPNNRATFSCGNVSALSKAEESLRAGNDAR